MKWAWPGTTARLAAEARQAALDSAREKAFQSSLDSVVRIVVAQAESMTQMQVTLQAYLEMFKTPSDPERLAPSDDYSEMLGEADRLLALKEAGFPIDMSHIEQLQWVMAKTGGLAPVPNLLT